MRRHVENQIERSETNSLGILVLLAMWILALMALSSAAHGQENQQSANGAQHHLTAKHLLPLAQQNKKTRDAEAAPGQPATDDEAELTRFILISIPDRQLALVDEGQVTRIYPIAVGASHTPSPHGNFTIVSRVSNPTWSHKGKVVGAGKNNPVGSRWMGLSLKGYGIHGTNAPRSIGKAASHGCFRMGKKEVEELFALVKVGDTVAVRNERDELVGAVFGSSSGSGGETQVASTGAISAETDEE